MQPVVILYTWQDDHELLEVAADLGIEIPLKRKESRTSLGQEYPIMDRPEEFEQDELMSSGTTPAITPVASPRAGPLPEDPLEVKKLIRASSVPLFSAPEPDSAREADSVHDEAGAADASASSDGRRQLILEELQACVFKPYANQVRVIRPTLITRSFRQMTLDEFLIFVSCEEPRSDSLGEGPTEHPLPEQKACHVPHRNNNQSQTWWNATCSPYTQNVVLL